MISDPVFSTVRLHYYEMSQRGWQQGDWEEWLWFFSAAVRHAATQAVETAKMLSVLGDTDRKCLRTLRRIASSALRLHQAMLARPVITILAICTTTGQSVHTRQQILHAMIRLCLVRELTGMKRGRINE